MPKKMFVTVLKLDTTATQSEGLGKRKARFEEALLTANEFVRKKMAIADNGRAVWNIFVAPEYSFANPVSHNNHEPGDVRHISEGSKVSLELWLKNLSTKHSRTLIFPGSIAWKKSTSRNLTEYMDRKKRVYDDVEKHKVENKFAAKVQTRVQKAITAINQNATEFQGGNKATQVSGDMTKFADYYHDGSDWWFLTDDVSGVFLLAKPGKRWTKKAELAKMAVTHSAVSNLDKLNELGGGKTTHLARNTSLIYLNGKKQAKYHKAQDYHEVLDAAGNTVYVPGTSVPTFSVEGTVYGVEICLDHVYESLRTRLPMAQTPEIVVLMSAKVEFDPAAVPDAAAMVIHACSDESWSFVGRGGVPDQDCTEEADETSYKIYSFDI